jgi:hypothetical protein
MTEKSGSTALVGVAAAATATVGGVVGHDPAAVASGLYDFVERAASFLRQRQQRVVEKLLQDAYFANGSDAGAFAEFRGLFSGDTARSNIAKNIFLQSVRVAEAAVDEAVYPALALLMRQYVREGWPYDGFFRSCSRLLQELSAEEYAS